MAEKVYDVVGIGNAIVDIIARCDEGFLSKHDLAKGFMRLIDAHEAAHLYEAMGPAVERSGGSVANTIAGLASFGAKCGFIGRVAADQFGGIFRHDIRSQGVVYETAPATEGAPTARCLILVTPDGERTMNTFLGVSVGLSAADIDQAMIENSKIIYLEGYLFDRHEAKEAFRDAARRARGAGVKVALSLSDAFCVDRHRDDFRKLVREGADIVFANEKEITSLYQVNSFEEAADLALQDCEMAVLTRSEAGIGDRGERRDDRDCSLAGWRGHRRHRRRRPLCRGLSLRADPRGPVGDLRAPRQSRRGGGNQPYRRETRDSSAQAR